MDLGMLELMQENLVLMEVTKGLSSLLILLMFLTLLQARKGVRPTLPGLHPPGSLLYPDQRVPPHPGVMGAGGQRPAVMGDGVLGAGVLGAGVRGVGVRGVGVRGHRVLGPGVLGQGVLGQGVLGQGVLGQGVLGPGVLGSGVAGVLGAVSLEPGGGQWSRQEGATRQQRRTGGWIPPRRVLEMYPDILR